MFSEFNSKGKHPNQIKSLLKVAYIGTITIFIMMILGGRFINDDVGKEDLKIIYNEHAKQLKTKIRKITYSIPIEKNVTLVKEVGNRWIHVLILLPISFLVMLQYTLEDFKKMSTDDRNNHA